VAEPAPLPSAAEGAPGPGAPGSVPAGPDLVGPAPTVPWQPETLSGLLDELIDAAEENRVGKYLAKCAEANLTAKLLKEIEADAAFPKTAKTILKHSLPRLAAKWLNKSGLSSEWQEEVAVITALLLIVQHDRRLSAKLDELIEAAKPKEEPAEEAKKGPEVRP
jgi:hypothetical protein